MARPERFELPTLCFEGRCSIQLSYGRAVCYCNPIIELAACDSDSPKSRFPRCAQLCAHPAATLPRTSRLRKDERTATKFGFGCGPRCERVSKRRSRTRPAGSETCGARNRARTGLELKYSPLCRGSFSRL